MTDTMYGTVIIDGYTYPITRLALAGGHLEIDATRHGPIRPCTGVPATVFGRDGAGICQSWHTTITPDEARADSITVQLRIKIIHMETT